MGYCDDLVPLVGDAIGIYVQNGVFELYCFVVYLTENVKIEILSCSPLLCRQGRVVEDVTTAVADVHSFKFDDV